MAWAKLEEKRKEKVDIHTRLHPYWRLDPY